jgi:non-heme chloroperoxidase
MQVMMEETGKSPMPVSVSVNSFRQFCGVCVTYDRRGAGSSSQPAAGYDWDTFAADLAKLIDTLGLEDVALVGHSMGTGEVTRYLSTYGSGKVDRAVLIGPIPPYLSQAPDNPDGVPANLFDGFRQAAAADTPAWLKGFLDNFYNIDQVGGNRVSDEAYRASFNVANTMSAIAAYACVATWQADFRDDLPKIDVPVLVIQGDADRVLPFDKTGKRLPGLIADVDVVDVEGGPHGIPWTHTDEVNAALLRFLGHPAA